MNNNEEGIADLMLNIAQNQYSNNPNPTEVAQTQKDKFNQPEIDQPSEKESEMLQQPKYEDELSKPFLTSGLSKQAIKGTFEGLGGIGDIQDIVRKSKQVLLKEKEHEKQKSFSDMDIGDYIDLFTEESGGSLLPFPTGSAKFPTTQELKKFTKEELKISEPENSLESYFYKIPNSVTQSLSMWPVYGGNPLITALSAGLGGAAYQTVKNVGGSEKAAQIADIGLNVIGAIGVGLMKEGTTEALKNNMYTEMRNTAGAKATGNTNQIEKELLDIISEAGQATGTERTLVANRAQDILNHLRRNGLPYVEAHAERGEINKLNENLFNVQGLTDKQYANRGLTRIRETLNNYLDQTKQSHPNFYEYMSRGDSITAALGMGDRIQHTIQKVFQHPKITGAAGIGAAAIQQSLGPLFGVLAYESSVLGVSKSARIMSHILNSPDLRYYYGRVLMSGAKENLASTANALRKFNIELHKDKEAMDILNENK